MIEQIIITLHILIALAIIALILLQQGKGADMGASFGGGGSQTLFGPSGGGNALTRATAILAALFFLSSFSLAIIAKQKATRVAASEQLLVEEPAVSGEVLDEAIFEQVGEDDVGMPDFGEGLDIEAVDIIDAIPE